MNVFVITTAALTLFTFMIQKRKGNLLFWVSPEFYLIPPLGIFFYYMSTKKTQSTYIKLQIVLSVVIAVFVRDIRVKYHSVSHSMNALAKIKTDVGNNPKLLDILNQMEDETRT